MSRRPHRPDPSEAGPVVAARAALERFREGTRPNFFTSDRQLQRLLRRALGEGYAQHEPHFARFGAIAAGPLDDAAATSNEPANLPRLDRWSPFGERLEGVANHPAYDACGRAIYEDGEVIAALADPAHHARALGLFFLSCHAGEAGHNCPVACTAGVVRALRAAGSEALKALYLPGLLTARYPERLDGAQFMTELQGGSDVGANVVVAEPDAQFPRDLGATRWRVTGGKWFCSNAEADLILMTARVADRKGTSGLGLFLVPRVVPEAAAGPEAGRLNALSLRRLKDKLGTRSMPSAEIDLHGAVAYALGPVEDGFRTMMTEVIRTSRIYNSVAVAGHARRARLVAQSYARQREAFGVPIGALPLVQAMLAEGRALGQACLAGAMRLAMALDAEARGELTDDGRAMLRVAANLTKMRTSQHAHRAIMLGVETLGGNGAIESFSVLPRLIRDNIVCENWEGTHNTLIAQTARDLGPAGLGPAVLRELEGLGARARDAVGGEVAGALAEAERATQEAIARLAEGGDPGAVALRFRRPAERLGDLLLALAWAESLADEADLTQREAELDALAVFVDLHLRDREPPPDLARAARLAALEG